LSPDEAEDMVARAADTLLEDAALEMAESTTMAFTALLMGVYERGKYPGNSSNPALNQLLDIVAKAGERRQQEDDHAENKASHDTY
jgi:hypothetical protein